MYLERFLALLETRRALHRQYKSSGAGAGDQDPADRCVLATDGERRLEFARELDTHGVAVMALPSWCCRHRAALHAASIRHPPSAQRTTSALGSGMHTWTVPADSCATRGRSASRQIPMMNTRSVGEGPLHYRAFELSLCMMAEDIPGHCSAVAVTAGPKPIERHFHDSRCQRIKLEGIHQEA